MNKGHPLIKPMMITGTDDDIVSVIRQGFADGKNSDAHILNIKNLMQKEKSIG